MTDRTQSAFARRFANRDLVTLRTTSETQDTDLKNQVTTLFNLYSNLESYAKNTNGNLEVLSSQVLSLTPILDIDQINFNLTPFNPTYLEGQLSWSSEYSSLILGITPNIAAVYGQAIYKKVRNNTASIITKGSVVYVTGSHGSTHITISLADASTEATAATTVGIAAEDIGINTEGFIITQGYLKGINTNSLSGSEGAMLWLSETAGEITTTRPTQPSHGVHVGWLIKKAGGGAGSIYVHISNGQELYEIHDVLITSPANNDVLTYEIATGLWKNKPVVGGGGVTEAFVIAMATAL